MRTQLRTLFCLIIGMHFANAQVADVSQYLMYFPFENNLTDASSQNVTLNPKTAATVNTYAAGQFGNAALFNDTPYITSGSTFDAGASFTMMMWVNFNSLSSATGTPKLIHQEDQGTAANLLAGRPLQLATANVTFNTSFGERGINSPASPVVGTWTHIAVVMDKAAGTSKMYVDGVLVVTPDNSVGPPILDNKTNNAQLSIGVQKASSTIGLLNALIDDFVITSQVLDATTINNIIANGAATGGAVPSTCATTTTYNGMSWDNGIPDPTTAAVIAGNFSLGSGATFESCDLTINNGVILNLGTGNADIYGNITNNGTIIGSTGFLAMPGDDAQTITGNAFEVGDFIIVNQNSAQITLSTDVTVTNKLELIDGVLDTTGGSLTLKSTAIQTAMVVLAGSSSSINGNVTVERFIPGKRAFRLLTSAVTTTSPIFNNWQQGGLNPLDSGYEAGNGTHITGSATGSNGFDTTSTGNPSLFQYDNINQSWTTVTNTDTNTLAAGAPYRLFVRGSRAVDLNTNTPSTDDTVLKATGTIATGDVAVPNLAPTAGAFNFIGNPYQAYVDINQVLGNAVNINTGFYYVWDPQLGTRGAYATVNLPAGSNTVGSAANQFLQPGQAAFVSTVATATSAITFRETHKSMAQNTAVFSTPAATSSIVGQLYINDNGAIAPTAQDGFGIYFDSAASSAVDTFDAPKLANIDESIAVQYGNDLLAIDNRQLPATTETIQLNHATYRATTYQYKIAISNVIGSEVFLEDAHLGTSTLLNDGVNYYDFNIDANNNSIDANRFSLKIQKTVLSIDAPQLAMEVRLIPNPVTTDMAQLFITGATVESQSSVRVYNLAGQQLLDIPVEFSNSAAQITGLSKLATGAYFMQIQSGTNSQTIKFIKN